MPFILNNKIMTKLILRLSICAFVVFATYSCKNNNEGNMEAGEVAEATAGAISYEVDTQTSEILWTGKKPLGSHNGTLKLASGEFFTNNNKIESGKFVIDMNSIEDKDLEGEDKANLEAHLKGSIEGKEDHFFDVKNHPNATFEITEAIDKEGMVNVRGNLTIKGKTNPVEFSANVTTIDGVLTMKSDAILIDRTKWAVNYGSKSVFDDLGDKFIDDTIEIFLNIVAKK